MLAGHPPEFRRRALDLGVGTLGDQFRREPRPSAPAQRSQIAGRILARAISRSKSPVYYPLRSEPFSSWPAWGVLADHTASHRRRSGTPRCCRGVPTTRPVLPEGESRRLVNTRFPAQHPQVRQGVPAERKGDREISEDLARFMDRAVLRPRRQRRRQRGRQSADPDRLCQQHPTGLTDYGHLRGVDHIPRIPSRTIHLESALAPREIGPSASPILPGQEHFSMSRQAETRKPR